MHHLYALEIQDALERLSIWEINKFSIVIDPIFNISGSWEEIQVDREVAGITEFGYAMQLIIKSCLKFTEFELGLKQMIPKDEESWFEVEFKFDIKDKLVAYRAHKASLWSATLQQIEHKWELGLTDFPKALNLNDLEVFLEEARPYGARVVTMKWNCLNGPIALHCVHANGLKESYDASWPEKALILAADIRNAVNESETLRPPTAYNDRSSWESSLEIYYEGASIRLQHCELLDIEDEIFSGILPLQELPWLVGDPMIKGKISHQDIDYWKMTGRLEECEKGLDDLLLSTGAVSFTITSTDEAIFDENELG